MKRNTLMALAVVGVGLACALAALPTAVRHWIGDAETTARGPVYAGTVAEARARLDGLQPPSEDVGKQRLRPFEEFEPNRYRARWLDDDGTLLAFYIADVEEAQGGVRVRLTYRTVDPKTGVAHVEEPHTQNFFLLMMRAGIDWGLTGAPYSLTKATVAGTYYAVTDKN